MRITIERQEIAALLSAHLTTKFNGEWDCASKDYEIPSAISFEQVTPEYLERKAREEVRLAEYRAKMDAEDTARLLNGEHIPL